MEITIRILQFVLSLSFLIVAHELGHFFFARIFKVRVEKFYLFFNPWFSLFKIKRGETEYGMGWLPLGGYVKISGMIDESMDKEQLKKDPQPYEFRSKPAYQRLLIMLGGVLVNFLMALLIYSGILYVWGEEYLPVQNAIYGYEYCQTAQTNGFQNGDKIIQVDGTTHEHLKDAVQHIAFDGASCVTLLRGDSTVILNLPEDFTSQMLANQEKTFAIPRMPFVVGDVMADLPAQKVGIQAGDRLISVDGTDTPTAQALVQAVKAKAGQEIALVLSRNNALDTIQVPVTADGVIGVALSKDILTFQRVNYSFFESIPAGINYGLSVLGSYISNLKLIFSSEGVKQLGGFATIATLFPTEWDWLSFWNMTAFLSIILAFMNILPIPALDGGHVLFLLVEIITRRKPSEKFLEYAQMVGMLLLFALLILANANDIIRFLF